MSPYRRSALRYDAPKAFKTSLKRKIKFAWDSANDPGNKSLLILIHSFVIVKFIIFEKNSALAAIEVTIVVALITIIRMLWSWFLFFVKAKQRNKRGKVQEELFHYKNYGFVSIPTNKQYHYMCGGCNKCFVSNEYAILHAYECNAKR